MPLGQFLERIQFFDGQRLFADDLQALESVHRELRWLHNQSLHQPGVGSGYAVVGKKGDKQVIIGAGYAIDVRGREIVLTESVVEPVPPVADDGTGQPAVYDLTVAYPDDAELKESETRQGVCTPAGVVRLRESPALCWVRLGADLKPVSSVVAGQVQAGLRILLTRIEVKNCALARDLSIVQRRNARPPELPYVSCGETDPDTTAWDVWMASDGPLGLTVPVDTSSAHFRVTPRYAAQIEGDRLFPSAVNRTLVLDGLVQVQDESPSRFTLRLLMPALDGGPIRLNPSALLSGSRATLLALLRKNRWRVVWFGVEG